MGGGGAFSDTKQYVTWTGDCLRWGVSVVLFSLRVTVLVVFGSAGEDGEQRVLVRVEELVLVLVLVFGQRVPVQGVLPVAWVKQKGFINRSSKGRHCSLICTIT
jgi:hypothetical protein